MKNNQLEYLKYILLSQLTIEQIDALKGTSAYKQRIKKLLNTTQSELSTFVEANFNNVYDADPTMTTNILNSIDDIITKIATSSLDELVMINSIIDKYNDNKEHFNEIMNIDFVELK